MSTNMKRKAETVDERKWEIRSCQKEMALLLKRKWVIINMPTMQMLRID